MFEDLLQRNRSYRRFSQERRPAREELEDLVSLVRLAPSANNLQPLRFFLSSDGETNRAVFSTLTWAASLPDWGGPGEGERPGAYIVILHDRHRAAAPAVDHGIAAHTILLGAAERGWGGCILGSIDRERLRKLLDLPGHLDILLVVALGLPGETIVLDEARGGEVRYWRDAGGVHHVPKRPLEDLLWN